MRHFDRVIGNRLKTAVWLLPLTAVLLISLSIPAAPGLQKPTRAHFPGTPIVVTFQAPGDLLQTFSNIEVVAVLKSGKSVTAQSRGKSGEVRIDTYGVEATQEEIKRGRTVADNTAKQTPSLYGVEDQQGEWYSFDDIERLVIKHVRNTADKTFDGYEYDVRVVYKQNLPDKPGFEISHLGGTASFGATIQGQFGTRLIGRRISFVLESPAGPPALHADREKVRLELADGGAPRTFTGGEEAILPAGTRISRCQFTGGTEARFTMEGNCQWTWSPDQGPAKIVLLGKDANLSIPYERDASTVPRFTLMSAYLTKANGNLVQAPVLQGPGETLMVKGTTTMTSATITLSGDPNYEDLESEIPLDGTKLKLVRKKSSVTLPAAPAPRTAPSTPVAPLIVAAPPVQPSTRVPVPGTPIKATFRPSGDLLQTFSNIQVVAALKNGKSVSVRSRGNAGEVSIDTFGVAATPAEVSQGRTVLDDSPKQTPSLYGVEDQDGEWHGFDDIDRLVIKHLRNTADKTFDGYEYEVRVTWKPKMPVNAGFEISHLGGTATFGTPILGQFGTRLIGRRIAFVLESQSGPPASQADREKVSLEVAGGSSALRTFSGGEEVILPEGTRVSRCEFTGGTEDRFTLGGNCQWTWSPDQGPAKIVLLGKDANLPVIYERDGSTAVPRFTLMSAYLTKADGSRTQATVLQGPGDTLAMRGTTTMTSATFTLSGDPNFEDLESVEVRLDGSRLKLLRRRPGVVVVLDASNRLDRVRPLALPPIAKGLEELSKSPIARKFMVAVSQEDGYQVIGDPAKTQDFFKAYRIDGAAYPQPRRALPSAQGDAVKYNEGFSGIKNRIVYIVPSDPTMDLPWRGAPPFDESKVELFVIEVGLDNGSQPWFGKFLETFFGGNFNRRYQYVKTPDELSRAIVELATR